MGKRIQRWTKQNLWKTAFKGFETFFFFFFFFEKILLRRFLNTLSHYVETTENKYFSRANDDKLIARL